jgi:hypothetical protein
LAMKNDAEERKIVWDEPGEEVVLARAFGNA